MPQPVLNLTDWERRVLGAYAAARSFHFTNDALNAYMREVVYDELSRKTATGRRVYTAYIDGFVHGMTTVLREGLYRNELEYCYVDTDGVLYSTHRESTHRSTEDWYKAGKGAELYKLFNGHFWRGTDKVFFGRKDSDPATQPA